MNLNNSLIEIVVHSPEHIGPGLELYLPAEHVVDALVLRGDVVDAWGDAFEVKAHQRA